MFRWSRNQKGHGGHWGCSLGGNRVGGCRGIYPAANGPFLQRKLWPTYRVSSALLVNPQQWTRNWDSMLGHLAQVTSSLVTVVLFHSPSRFGDSKNTLSILTPSVPFSPRAPLIPSTSC